jgi:hypothetical protein
VSYTAPPRATGGLQASLALSPGGCALSHVYLYTVVAALHGGVAVGVAIAGHREEVGAGGGGWVGLAGRGRALTLPLHRLGKHKKRQTHIE